MAKIVTYDKQVNALNTVTDLLKVLSKLRPLLDSQSSAQEYKVSIAVVNEDAHGLKASYLLSKEEGLEMLKIRFNQVSKSISQLSEEYHIELSPAEQELMNNVR